MGVVVNAEKTKYMMWNYKPYKQGRYLQVELEQGEILKFEEIETCTYLGTLVTRQTGSNEEIKIRIVAENKSAYTLQKILTGGMFSRKVKIKVYKTMIRPVVT